MFQTTVNVPHLVNMPGYWYSQVDGGKTDNRPIIVEKDNRFEITRNWTDRQSAQDYLDLTVTTFGSGNFTSTVKEIVN